LGIGNLRCGPTVVGGLASFFGERPIDVSLYDAEIDRLALFERFARVTFGANRTPHEIYATTDPAEALFEPDQVILCLDRNCAFRILREHDLASDLLPSHTCALSQALERLLFERVGAATVLSMLPPEVRVPLDSYFRIAAPPEPTFEQRQALPHQILRWIKEDDMLYEFLAQAELSPVKVWLEDPSSAELVSES
jgi:hypothetical protein